MSLSHPNLATSSDTDVQTTFFITTVNHSETPAVSVHGDLDQLTAPQLIEAVGFAVSGKRDGLIIDLTCTSFLSSAGLKALDFARECSECAGIPYAVVAHGSATARPLRLVGPTPTIAIFDDFETALRAIRTEVKNQSSPASEPVRAAQPDHRTGN